MRTSGLITLAFTALILFSCSSSKEKMIDEITQMEDQIFSETSNKIDLEQTAKLVDMYITFADRYSKSEEAPDYIFRAADISMNLLDPNKSVELFDRILDNYPEFEKYPHCLFLKAYVYENELHNLDKARELYLEFLEKYPDHDFADDVQVSLDNLGKSPEELIREFQEKAKADSIQ